MRRILAESLISQATYHCPISLCNHIEKSKEEMIQHLIDKHTNEQAWNEMV